MRRISNASSHVRRVGVCRVSGNRGCGHRSIDRGAHKHSHTPHAPTRSEYGDCSPRLSPPVYCTDPEAMSPAAAVASIASTSEQQQQQCRPSGILAPARSRVLR